MTTTYPNSSTNTFTYNGLDTRVGKVDSTGTKTYKRDGAYVTDPVLSDSSANYTPGISERRSSTTKFYHTDRLGTTERLTNTSQTTTDTREYDAFGLLVSSSGSTPTPFGFAGTWGYQEDTDSGLKLLGHRYYDPGSGRFLTRDPLRDQANWYTYCSSNMLRAIDPTGLKFTKLKVGTLRPNPILYWFEIFFGAHRRPVSGGGHGGGGAGAWGGDPLPGGHHKPDLNAGDQLVETWVDLTLDLHPPPGVGTVGGLGTLGANAANTTGSGLHVIGGIRARTEAALMDDFETAGKSYDDAYEIMDPVHKGWPSIKKDKYRR